MAIESRDVFKLVSDVAPINSVSIGDWSDKTTWRIDFKPEATAQQQADALDVIDAIDINEPTTKDIKDEAQRRIIALSGATSLNDCIVKQLNASMRASELINKKAEGGTLTTEEQVEEAALKALADGIKLIRAKSNEIEAMTPRPADYTNNSLWEESE